ncbi:MAG: phosphoglucomutase/phosphomannomutase family protein [Candidatus Omnitrophica bacterium]|nr:phosphoglucomutase/phosphomannomutase family protein [Candidatus Omnitrophota bacterium]
MRKKPVIKFGTDGWRAVIAGDFTFENVAILSQAVSDYFKSLKSGGQVEAVIGFDTRFLSREFAHYAAEVLVANRIKVILSDRAISTPALSFATKSNRCDFGIMITASHNPPEFNGFKIKDSFGGAADTDITKAVEKLLHKNKVKKASLANNRYCKVKNLITAYEGFLKKYLDLRKIHSRRLNVLVDVMHGSGNAIIPDCIGSGKVKVTLMRSDVNPSFDGARPEPLPENLSQMIHRMKNEKFDLGLVLDGDADRIAALDSDANFISPQVILCLLILHLFQDRKEKGAVVKTVVGTTLLDKVCAHLKLKLFETPVGFKYISKLMKETTVLVGGEEAGGIGFKNYIPERDGSLAGLLLLEMLSFRGRSIKQLIKELKSKFGSFYYTKDSIELHNVGHFNLGNVKVPKKILGKDVVRINRKDGLKLIGSDESWLMLRPSGTEPIVRVYAEAATREKAERLISLGKKMIRS